MPAAHGARAHAFDFLHRCFDRFATHYDERLETVRLLAAEVIGKAMVGPDKADFNFDVVRGRRQSREA